MECNVSQEQQVASEVVVGFLKYVKVNGSQLFFLYNDASPQIFILKQAQMKLD